MWRIVFFLAVTPCLHAQLEVKPIDWSKHMKVTASSIQRQLPHIHPHAGKCKGVADGIYLRSGKTYYACIGQKDVCSDEKDKIPRSYIAAFDARMEAHNERMREFKAAMSLRRASRAVAPETIEAAPARRAPASPVRPQPPVADERVAALTTGASADEVIGLLGEPHSKFTGDFQRFTYRLASGGTARLEFEEGKLTRRQITPAP